MGGTSFAESSQKVHKFISTLLLTVLTISVILQLEQRKGVQKKETRKGFRHRTEIGVLENKI